VSDAQDAVVLLDGDPVVIRLGYEQFAERLQSYMDVAETLRDRMEDIDYVDLRFGEHVYVRPRAGSAKNAVAQSGPAARRSKPAGD
jgi:cell division septal protein FtsQ